MTRRRQRATLALGMMDMVVCGGAEHILASNMGFKMNKRVVKGANLLSLPIHSTPLDTAKNICAVFGKITSATQIPQYPDPPAIRSPRGSPSSRTGRA